ncbi:hypothetical protein [Massilia sp. Leaf139]|uniref:hypothetical protein n=1 Tax=Massilia sp. Leaf139 TaxID=1736272 RepID=UPI0006F6DD32|nr:hypothetical protein [Massilia sp. Leaf139]KQQ87199.1 hypothetical protein ASF77_16535 [Massilia sp. Leaf139]
MKKSILALCALTLAAGLSACGGGSSDFTISGTVTGLEHPGLILTNNLSDDLPVGPLGKDDKGNVRNVTYQFGKQLSYGDTYNVTIKKQPDHQKCEPGGGTAETAGRLSVINAVFNCVLSSHTIGGTITGLNSDGLILNNGGNQFIANKNTTTNAYPGEFTFGAPVVYGTTYGVTVLAQPKNEICTVSGGVGEMKDDDVKTIVVTCTARPPAAA